ncbi:MAG: peptidoglycan/LPS O-acetylase OafA/YrhL [Phenylobacterium sp.]
MFKDMDRNDGVNLSNFYMRRLLRLTPALLVLVVFSYIIEVPNYQNLWHNLFYINNFYSVASEALPHTWSLAIEEQFYIVFALLMVMVKKPQKLLIYLVGLAVLAVVIKCAMVMQSWSLLNVSFMEFISQPTLFLHYLDTIYIKPYARFGSFIFGALVMYGYRYKLDSVKAFYATLMGKLTVVMAIIAVMFLSVFLNTDKLFMQHYALVSFFSYAFTHYLFSAASALIILALMVDAKSLTLLNKFLSMRVWYPIAQLAYSIYLFHILVVDHIAGPVIQMLRDNGWIGVELVHSMSILIIFGLTLFFSLCVSALVYILVERPFMILRDKYFVAKKTPELNLNRA